jgi:hypothetical protein
VRGSGCDYHTIPYQHVERAVLSVVWSILIPKLKELNFHELQLNATRGELSHIQGVIDNLTTGLRESGAKSKTIFNTVAQLEQEAETLKQDIERLEAIGNTNALLDWEPVEQSVENRLRIQSILRDTIKNLSINAGERKATLVVHLRGKDSETMTFQLSWDQGRGANQTKDNPADSHFYANDMTLTYEDQHLVWKSVLTFNSEIEHSIININPEVTEFTPAYQ